MNNKRKIVLTSILSIVVCLMLIAGATFAMFTDESKVSIAVTGGKIDLEAEVVASSLKAYSQSYNYEQNKYEEKETVALLGEGKYVAPFTVANGVQTGGIAEATATQVTLDHMAPLDRVTFDIEIKNHSDIDAAYRIYVIENDEGLFNALTISYTHDLDKQDGYSFLAKSTDWTTISHTTGNGSVVETVGVEIVFPDGGKPSDLARTAEAGDNQYQGKKCTLTFVVEAYQAYAKLDPQAQAPRTWLVSNQEGLTAVAGLCNSGDTIIIKEPNLELTLEYNDAKTVTLKGEKIKKLTTNAPNGIINVYNDVEKVEGAYVAMDSAHLFGKIDTLDATKGHFVVEAVAEVENIQTTEQAVAETLKIDVLGKVKTLTTEKGTIEIAGGAKVDEIVATANTTDDLVIKVAAEAEVTKLATPAQETAKSMDIQISGKVETLDVPKANENIVVKVASTGEVAELKLAQGETEALQVKQEAGATIGNQQEIAGKIVVPYPVMNATTGKKYDDIQKAINAAQSGETIQMLDDYKPTKTAVINVKTNDFVLTIDLNGKTVEMPSTLQLTVGTYNIVDTSAEKNGKINKIDLNNSQNRLNTITVNVYGGSIDRIATDGDNGDKTLNIYGGSIRLVEVQGSEKAGPQGTAQERPAIDKVNIYGGKIEYVSVWWERDISGVVTFDAQCNSRLGEEITGAAEDAIRQFGTSYNTYKVESAE